MNETLAHLARVLNPLIGGLIMLAGSFAGGLVSNSPMGAILGAVAGAALGLGISGIIGMLGTIEAKLDRASAAVIGDKPRARVLAATSQPAIAPVAGPAAGYIAGHAMNGQAGPIIAPAMPPASPVPAAAAIAAPAVAVASTLPAGAPIEAAKIEATETEAQLLAAGRFADYHLAKAKRLFAAKSFRDAAHQAAASLAHGELPEAAELRKSALAALK